MTRRSLQKTALAMVVGAAALLAAAMPVTAATFFGWQVINLEADDLLNVRTGPGTGHHILVGYPNQAPLSLTGPCTGGVDLNAIAHLPKLQQKQAVRFEWCQVWIDPYATGNWQAGWVYGRYIQPL